VKRNKLKELNPSKRGVKVLTGIKPFKIKEYYYTKNKDDFMGSENRKTRTRYETEEERRQRIAEQNANIQRVDAQVNKYFKKK